MFEQFRSGIENMQRLSKFCITFQDFSGPPQVYMMVSPDGELLKKRSKDHICTL